MPRKTNFILKIDQGLCIDEMKIGFERYEILVQEKNLVICMVSVEYCAVNLHLEVFDINSWSIKLKIALV